MNKTDQINAQLDALRKQLLPFGVTAVRMDYMVTDKGENRRTLNLDRHGMGNRFAVVSKRPHLREGGIKAMTNFLPMNAETAHRVLDLAEELSELNDMGAWPLETTDREPAIADSRGVDGTPYKDLPGFRRRFNNLRDSLRSIQRIRIDEHVAVTKKGNSRKAWVSFYDFDGEQVVSIAVNHLATMLRDWYGTDEKAQPVADANVGRWAHQLSMNLDEFMDIAMDLLSFDNYLRVTDIHLDGEA